MILFLGEHFHNVLTARLQSTANSISELTLSQLSNPALAGMIEKLWAAERPDIPMMYPERKSGKQQQGREERNDYGRRTLVDVTFLDVYLPFDGDANMFNVMPSSSQMIMERIFIEHGNLRYRLLLDDASDDKINRLCAQIENNLKALRTDLDNFSRNALAELSRLAADRKAKLEADAQKASKLSFPVS